MKNFALFTLFLCFSVSASALEKSVATQQTQTTANIASLNSKIDALISSNEIAFEQINQRIDSLETDINSSIDVIKNDIQTLGNDVKSLGNTTKSLESRISALEAINKTEETCAKSGYIYSSSLKKCIQAKAPAFDGVKDICMVQRTNSTASCSGCAGSGWTMLSYFDVDDGGGAGRACADGKCKMSPWGEWRMTVCVKK